MTIEWIKSRDKASVYISIVYYYTTEEIIVHSFEFSIVVKQLWFFFIYSCYNIEYNSVFVLSYLYSVIIVIVIRKQ